MVPSQATDPEELFAAWLEAREVGGAAEFSELLARHAAHAQALRRMHADWEQFAPILARVVPGSIGEVELAAGVPRPSLEDEAREPPSDDLLQRLGFRLPEDGRYRFRKVIGQGGGGVVLRVWDAKLQRPLAMKVVLGRGETRPAGDTPPVDAAALTRFVDEARIASQLDHPGIVPVHELGTDASGRAFFTMRLVRGEDLGKILERVRLGEPEWTQARLVGILARVCEAVGYAHEKGVVHRDLKPGNVMVGRHGEVHVMDWGLARAGLGARAAPHSPPLPSGVHSVRGDEREASPRSPLLTGAGAVVGTPAYMSPEQARGLHERVDARTDVYALGAMLYELLAGEPPFVPRGANVPAGLVLMRVVEGPPAPLAEKAPRAPDELVAICERAMAREPERRYGDTDALERDLRAYLEGRVVAAYESGAWAEARKWMRRNVLLTTALAAALLLLVGGLAVSLGFKLRADRNALLAEQRAADILALWAPLELRDLVEEANALWPAHPENVEHYRVWLERAERLLLDLPAHRARLQQAQLAQARRHLEIHRAQRATLESGKPALDPAPEQVGVDFELLPDDAVALNGKAWGQVNPNGGLVGPDHGDLADVAQGLVLARRALALADELAPTTRAEIRDTLAWALFWAGRGEEALAEERRAVAEARPERAAEFEQYLADLERRLSPEGLAQDALHVAELEASIVRMEAETPTQLSWTFVRSADPRWHEQLSSLVSGLEALRDPEAGLFGDATVEPFGWGISKRYAFASTIAERSVHGAEPQRLWRSAASAVADSPRYRGLVLRPQLGLLPLGPDPVSGLWEFAHLQTGERPLRGADGRLILTEDTGLVFVLIPGGTAWIGAQATDPSGRNYDPRAHGDEGPVQEVELPAFFLSKYEMTQGQWQRVTGNNPSFYGPAQEAVWSANGRPWSALHPVENVSWEDCTKVMGWLALALPTEVQWECAARGGTATPWWTGDAPATLQDRANVADRTAREAGAPWGEGAPFADGWIWHAPIGSLPSNGFGLHDVIGNVWEWCRDRYTESYESDPDESDPHRVLRGGSFVEEPAAARASMRLKQTTEPFAHGGLRPVRSVTP